MGYFPLWICAGNARSSPIASCPLFANVRCHPVKQIGFRPWIASGLRRLLQH
jgi:hypothetical protein